jgi:cytochrome c-type biogenesis protein CcmH
MRLPRLIAALALVFALGSSSTLVSTAAAHVNFYSVVDQFMCTSCHEPLNQVNSAQALSEKQTLRGLVNRGLTFGQIKSAMVAQYGPQVLARPAASGFNLTVYILPPVVFFGGLALLAYTLPKWRERARRAAATRLPGAEPLESDDAKRLDDELTNFI